MNNKQKSLIKNNNLSDDNTPSLSTLAYSKKYNSNSINNQNMTEDHNNKFRIGLLSAFSNSNNIIIPMIPVQRPLSNFNLGGGQLWENIENLNKNTVNNIKIEQNNKQLNINKKLVNNINIIEGNKLSNEMRNKIGTAPAQKINEYNYFYKNERGNIQIKKNYSNILRNNMNNINNYMPKYHHIKIEKSLMNNKFTVSLNKNLFKNYMSLEKNNLPKIKNNYFNDIKKIHNLRKFLIF